MVEFSLKNRNRGKNPRQKSPSKVSNASSPAKSASKPAKSSNPYSDMNMTAQYSQLPTINAKDKNKVASSMQRRLSVHNANYVPPKLDYSMPLPSTGIDEGQVDRPVGETKPVGANRPMQGRPRDPTATRDDSIRQKPAAMKSPAPGKLSPAILRRMLADPKFNAKTFVRESLGDASAIEIDEFTSSLGELAVEVQEEAKDNVNKSYNEILTVNRDLSVASLELKQLRSSVSELSNMMQEFFVMAEKRLQTEEHKEQFQRKGSSAGLLPPVGADGFDKKRDRSSVAILEKIWDNQLATLFKNVEGARKYIGNSPGRHILMESGDWIELNIATLKPLQSVHIFILSDMVLVASRPKDKQKELLVAHCGHLRDVNVSFEGASSKRLSFSFGPSTRCIYESRDPEEAAHLLNVVRKAKDDFHDIYHAEEESAKKIKESFSYLQYAQQTPGRENTKSPVKNSRRSLGSFTPGKTGGEDMDNFLIQKISMTMHSRTRSRDVTPLAQKLKSLSNGVEEIDIELGRLKFDKAVNALTTLESQLKRLADQGDDDDMMLYGLITLKLDQRRESVASKLSQTISTTSETAPLMLAVKNMIRLGLPEDGLDLFLQNRSNLIKSLILQTGSLDNPTNYLIQIAVIRFQIIRKTVINFKDIFQNDKDKFSSILVNWCREEVERHFELIDKSLPSDETISPASIRSSRKQIDGLKSVGIDFVYKLDEFIKKNNHKIH